MSAGMSEISSQAAVGYFVDQKKGEVNELKQLLKNINVERDAKRKREIIKKVIAYMTLGIDVSRLFTDMIMAIETKDIVVKKMVYLYLCSYAVKEPEMAIMCINSLRRDCDNEDPWVRGLALRSLCNLRLESILEYIELPLKKSLVDISSYVRKTGVMAILKVHKLSPNLVSNNRYIEKLYEMLLDLDANVITNVIHVLNELQLSTGGIELNQAMLMNLLNRIGEFSEWGLNTILDLVSRYKPSSEEEAFSIMNLLDPVLRTANSGAVLATLKCFLKLTEGMPDLQPQVYQRAKPPMLTLITGSHPELQYTILKHLQIVLSQPAAKTVFDDEYRQFFVRYNEPPYVKHLKVDLLPMVTNESNAKEVSTELGEYATDIDPELSKRAIRSIAVIAIKISSVSVDMTQILMELVDMDVPYVRAEAAKVIADIVRVSVNTSMLVLPHLSRLLKRTEDTEAKASLIWLLGEFGESIIEAPYILEPIIDNYNEESAVNIKLQVLTAAMKLFFKRPPEVQRMLGRVLKAAINDTSNQDLHDRALLYYRLLLNDPSQSSKSLFSSNKACFIADGVFAESKEWDKRDRLFAEFNSLSILYDIPSEQFISDENQLKSSAEGGSMAENTELEAMIQSGPMNPAVLSPVMPTSSHQQTAVGSINLLDWDDPHPAPVLKGIVLKDISEPLTPAKFQQIWSSLPDAFNGFLCNLSGTPTSTGQLETVLKTGKVLTIASGPLPANSPAPGVKLFVYSMDELRLYLLQLIIQTVPSYQVMVTIKFDATNADVLLLSNSMKSTLITLLAPFQPKI